MSSLQIHCAPRNPTGPPPLTLVNVERKPRQTLKHRPRPQRWRPEAPPRPWEQLALPHMPAARAVRRKARNRRRSTHEDWIPPWVGQLEIEYEWGIRIDRKDRLARVGVDPNPDSPWEEAPDSMRHFADWFPGGMTFTEIGVVLGGMRKQAVFKIYQSAMAKAEAALREGDDDIEAMLGALEDARDRTASAWDP